MHYRLFGPTGLRVSELFLGAMTFGDQGGVGAPPEECARILDTYAEAGGNVVDTAVNYRGGQSEEILAQLLQGRRDRFVLSTVYTVTRDRDDPNAAGNHRKNLRQSRSHLGSPPGVNWSCTFPWPSLCMCGRARSVSSGSPRRIWGFRRCLSRSQLAAPLALLPLDHADRRDRKHGRTGDVGGKGIRYPIGAG